MPVYSNTLKLKDALQLYFSKYHFENGGYHLKWFKIKVGFVYIPFPNTKGRIAAVKIHDIHHIITEYEATLKGEAEISGWEIASGCGNYYIGWALNFASFFYGLFFFPRAMFRSFMRGRKVAVNCYYNTLYDEVLLNKTVGELRAVIEPKEIRGNTLKDYLAFAGYSVFVLTGFLGPFFLLCWLC